MGKLKIMSVLGTRPEAIKMAPLIHELKKYQQIESLVCVTAQHRQMLDQVLEVFNIIPHFDLNIMKENQTLIEVTTRALEDLDRIFKQAKPDMILVHGDTSTTFMASLAAFYNKIDVAHVEAGLRTCNIYLPFPEEANRQLTSIIAKLHFAPTKQAAMNLLSENKDRATIFITGNTITDALKMTVRDKYKHEVLDNVGNRKLILVTVHRRENLGEPLKGIFRAILKLADAHEDIAMVFPVHLNPAIQEVAKTMLGNHPRIHLISPLNVVDFHNLIAHSYLILTDSGGIQEESPNFGVPVLLLRNLTERPEGVEAGIVKLAGAEENTIYSLTHQLLVDKVAYKQMATTVNPYGDGHASRRIVQSILFDYGLIEEKPDMFCDIPHEE